MNVQQGLCIELTIEFRRVAIMQFLYFLNESFCIGSRPDLYIRIVVVAAPVGLCLLSGKPPVREQEVVMKMRLRGNVINDRCNRNVSLVIHAKCFSNRIVIAEVSPRGALRQYD